MKPTMQIPMMIVLLLLTSNLRAILLLGTIDLRLRISSHTRHGFVPKIIIIVINITVCCCNAIDILNVDHDYSSQ